MKSPLSDIPIMKIGNKPIDGGNYLFTTEEKRDFIKNEPNAKTYFRKWLGSIELITGKERWCLLVQEIPERELEKMPLTKERIENVRQVRLNSKSAPTRAIAKTPLHFHVENFPTDSFIVVPEISSEKRPYITAGFFEPSVLASNRLNVVSSSEPYLFGVLSSKMHHVWVHAVGGKLETRISYSVGICYNAFPFPKISRHLIEELRHSAFLILEEREKHSEKTLAELYNPDKMPKELLDAHHQNDLAVEKCYRHTPFSNDDERLEYLFSLYERMIELEQSENTLFADEVRKKRKRRVNA
jgi:hypothetical protein